MIFTCRPPARSGKSLILFVAGRVMVPFFNAKDKSAFASMGVRNGDDIVRRLSLLLGTTLIGGCILMPGGTVVDSAMVVHTTGAAKSTISARVPADAGQVYDAFVRVLEEEEDIEVVSRKDDAMLMEVRGDFGDITAQATPLGPAQSLLYVWADAEGSGRSGGEVATRAIERICDELGVGYEVVQY
jgi:hypothetical protein